MQADQQTPAAEVLDWFLDVLAGREELSDAAYAERATTHFAAAVPLPAFQDFVAGLTGDWVAETSDGDPTGRHVTGVLTRDGERKHIRVSVTPDAPHLLTGLLVRPLASPDAPPTEQADRGLPDTLAVEGVCWFLDLLEHRITTSPEDYAARFTDSFRGNVSFDHFRSVVHESAGVYTVERHVELDGMPGIVAVVSMGDALLEISLVRAPEAPHLIVSLSIRPTTRDPVVLGSYDDLDEHLVSLGHDSAWLVARAHGGGLDTVAGRGIDEVMPLGSIFKLYILGALALEIERGAIAWDDTVTVQDRLRNERTRGMGAMAEGEHITVLEAAKLMIGISCNTATDHLLDLVGRDAVESVLETMGHHDPSRTVPFLSSREMFLIKWGVDPAVSEKFIAANETGRRAILAGLPAGTLDLWGLAADGKPRSVDALEWFATPADVARALVWLADREPEVRDILGTNPGLPRSTFGAFVYAGYKGGSEPGVLTGSWYLEPQDGAAHVLVIMLRDTQQVIDKVMWLATIGAALELLH